jgi:hypothetical protein
MYWKKIHCVLTYTKTAGLYRYPLLNPLLFQAVFNRRSKLRALGSKLISYFMRQLNV